MAYLLLKVLVLVPIAQYFGAKSRRFDDLDHNEAIENEDGEVGNQLGEDEFAPDDINRSVDRIRPHRCSNNDGHICGWIKSGCNLKAKWILALDFFVKVHFLLSTSKCKNMTVCDSRPLENVCSFVS